MQLISTKRIVIWNDKGTPNGSALCCTGSINIVCAGDGVQRIGCIVSEVQFPVQSLDKPDDRVRVDAVAVYETVSRGEIIKEDIRVAKGNTH